MAQGLSCLGLVLMLSISGCVASRTETKWPEPRSLGADIAAYQPPTDPELTEPDEFQIQETSGAITLGDALAMALVRSPELRAFSWEVRAAEARGLQAGLMPNPKIEVEVEEFGETGNRSGFDGSETTLQLGQLIERAGKRQKRIHLASLDTQLAGWDYESKRLDIFTRTTEAFVAVLAAQEHLALIERLVHVSQQVLDAVSRRVEAGKDAMVEKIKAEVALSTVEIHGKQARQRLESARNQLAAVWGSNTATFEQVTGQYERVAPIPPSEALIELIDQNPDIARWTAELDQRRAALDLEQARATLDPTAFAGPQWFNDADDLAFIVGVSVPLPVFDRNQGNILEARYNILLAQEKRLATGTNVLAALAQAYQGFSSAHTEATDLKTKVLPGARNAFDAVTRGYQEGKFDYLDVLDAQRTLFEVEGLYIDALAAYHTGRTQVERLIGQSISDVDHAQHR